MAKQFVLPIVCLLLLTACQQQGLMVQTLPPPNFNGPIIAQRPMQPMMPLPPLPRFVPPVQPAHPPIAGIPKEWIPLQSPRDWKWIIIHHSATPTGGAAAFDRMHRAKGWDELGYHFVIGNGTDTGDGQIEVGSRWPKQKYGAHDRTPDNRYNLYGIGICLVGNFDITHPTPAQMHSVCRLVAYLMRTYHISSDHVLGHGDTKSTDCPGRNMHVAEVRRMALQILAVSNEGIPPAVAAKDPVEKGELMRDVSDSSQPALAPLPH